MSTSIRAIYPALLVLLALSAAASCAPRSHTGVVVAVCGDMDYSAIVRLVTVQSVQDAAGTTDAKGWTPTATTPGECTPEGYWHFSLYEDDGRGRSPDLNQMSIRVAPAGRLLSKEVHAELMRLTDELAARDDDPYGASLSFPPVGARAWFRVVEDDRRTIVRMTFTTHDEAFDVEFESNTEAGLPPASSYWNYPGLLEEAYRKAASENSGG